MSFAFVVIGQVLARVHAQLDSRTVTWGMCSFVITCFIASVGHGEPPMTPGKKTLNWTGRTWLEFIQKKRKVYVATSIVKARLNSNIPKRPSFQSFYNGHFFRSRRTIRTFALVLTFLQRPLRHSRRSRSKKTSWRRTVNQRLPNAVHKTLFLM